VTTRILVIWSLPYLNNGTYMPYSDGFTWNVGFGMNYQWYERLKEID